MQALSQGLYPERQVSGEQVVLTHATLPGQSPSLQQPPAGMQAPPQGFWSAGQLYAQLCVDRSHLPTFPALIGQLSSWQQAPMGKQAPAHSFVLSGHLATHLLASQPG
jgi:hypothetical protein